MSSRSDRPWRHWGHNSVYIGNHTLFMKHIRRVARLQYAALLMMLLSACMGPGSKPTGDLSQIPSFTVDPSWPKPLPNHWMLGEVAGVAVDADDHVWILQRRILTEREMGAVTTPPMSECCAPAPAVIEFDAEGNVVQAWGGQDTTQHWFTSEHGLFVDGNHNVWVGGNNVKDEVIQKFSKEGKLLLQIGEWGVSGGSNDTQHLGGPADLAVDEAANEVYIADGYRNRRVIVFEATTGAYKRHWGAYGEVPDDSPLQPYVAGEKPIRSFRNVHSVNISKDGLVYVTDRPNNRIQIFQKDGKFLREAFLATHTLNTGALWDMAFSPDAAQTYLYIADGMNMKVRIVLRSSLEEVGTFGHGGRNAGEFGWMHNMASDSKGNLFTVEVNPGKRVQKFVRR